MPRLGLEDDFHSAIKERLLIALESSDERFTIGKVYVSLALESSALVERQSNIEDIRVAEEAADLCLVCFEAHVRYERRERWLFRHRLEVEIGRQIRLGRRRKFRSVEHEIGRR